MAASRRWWWGRPDWSRGGTPGPGATLEEIQNQKQDMNRWSRWQLRQRFTWCEAEKSFDQILIASTSQIEIGTKISCNLKNVASLKVIFSGSLTASGENKSKKFETFPRREEKNLTNDDWRLWRVWVWPQEGFNWVIWQNVKSQLLSAVFQLEKPENVRRCAAWKSLNHSVTTCFDTEMHCAHHKHKRCNREALLLQKGWIWFEISSRLRGT